MSNHLFRAVSYVALVAGGILAGTSGSFAQSVYCPASTSQLPVLPGNVSPGGVGTSINYTSGTCTNDQTGVGAFSGAALASQALSDLTQSVTTQENAVVSETIRERRRTEVETCPSGLVRIDGACIRRQPAAAAPVARVAAPRAKAKPVAGRRVPAPRPSVVVETTPAPVLLSAPRYGAWAQAYGNYERRTGTGASSITYNDVNGGTGLVTTSLYITAKSESRTGGLLAGVDMTTRGLYNADDGFIGGVLAGYSDSHTVVRTQILSGDLNTVPNGFSRFKATLKGPTVGLYGTYFNGGFSADASAKVAFYDLGISFNDALAFSGSNALGNGNGANNWLYTAIFPYAGSGSANVVQTSLVGNVNYRFPMSATWWIEPTAGIQWVHQGYNGGASALGLADGDLVRIQGGARVGTEFLLGSAPATLALTGLIYSNVALSGGFIQNGIAGPGAQVLNDEGLVRGQGSLKLTVAHGGGWSSYAETDVYGGERLFGLAGKLGVRYQW
ncbi:hypothetical protein GCM10007036_23790 [Alsobacter metallidurans]|uniref:Autotransporter domain-containing protein n=1 Tax=Alsobacter metallidurans TaxID=340221 RepID=A0A917I7G0_9HYPH|nr:autotransporter outer membrane beta-barrel domain-containing protein [Alsobacter metallidurans]GGH20306.1 hypothetical protein GCM10007036_23790 [Alsobacter metallidurans]